jgi:hypothetical protein
MESGSSELYILRQLLLDAEYPPILELARNKKRILSLLTALTYDQDPIVSERALKLTGLAAEIIYQRDAEYVRNYLLRLFWLVSDESGGIGWRAPELIGEILSNCPQLDQFFPLLISLLDLEKEDAPRFLPGILWAVGRVAQVNREAMLPALPRVRALIAGDMDKSAREMALWCLRQLNPSR